jgi:hypothetical protein
MNIACLSLAGHLFASVHRKKNTFMGFKPSTKAGSFTLAPAGNHPARCYGVVDLGHHMATYQGKEQGLRLKALLLFEFPTKLHKFDENKGEEPFTLTLRVTNSLSEKGNLRPILESWTGRQYTPEWEETFQLDKVLGWPAMVQVAHKDKENGDKFAKIITVAQVPDGLVVPPAILKPFAYSVEEGRNEKFKSLPQWIQEECNKCDEWKPKPQSEVEAASAAPSGGPSTKPGNPF